MSVKILIYYNCNREKLLCDDRHHLLSKKKRKSVLLLFPFQYCSLAKW